MQPQLDPRARRSSIEPTDARQASPRKTNFRVLLASMALAVAVGVVLVVGFWRATPPRVDASSGGNPSQNTQQAAPPSATAQPGAGGAPETAPATTTPPAQNPSTP
ncbi:MULTISPECIES: hypothetical protein [unclassified Hyphomicrobium]|uniref:hypothetical protein n=1 Tax=unclassified Hyphomicrobium TaxID=2619925 RepID=UPI000213F4D4|nr:MULTISPECIES: hypothetical protein [unclassified Hyphomicrobium]CCB67370.1 conserved protein of unknown function [Hyphomicrobium sp. MC1]